MQRCLPSQQVIQKSVCVVAFHPTGCPPRGVHAHVPQNVSLFLALLLACVHVLLHPIPQDGPHVVSTLLFLRMCLYFLLSYWRLCMCCCIPPHRMAPTWCPRSCSSDCVSIPCSLIGVCVRLCMCCCIPPHRMAPHVVSTLAILKMCLCLSLSSYGRVRVCAVASHFLWTCACLCCCLPLLMDVCVCLRCCPPLLMDVCVYVCAVAPHSLWTCACVRACAVAPHFLWTCACLRCCLPLLMDVCVFVLLPPTSYSRVRVSAVAPHFLWTCACLCCCLPLFRIAPHVVFTLMFLDALPKFEKKIGL